MFHLEMLLLTFVSINKLAIFVRHIVTLLPLYSFAFGVRDLHTALERDLVALRELLFDVASFLDGSTICLG
jgi:hypothetical protein